MNPGPTGLAKIAAVVFSSTLAALFVYDRATGGAFYRQLTAPAAAATTPVSSTSPQTDAPSGTTSEAAPPILFSGSKSFSRDATFTTVISGTVELQKYAPAPNPPPPAGPTLPARPDYTNASPDSYVNRPNTIMMGSKSAPVFTPPMQQAAPQSAAANPFGSQAQSVGQPAAQSAGNGPNLPRQGYAPPRQPAAPRSENPIRGNAGAIRDF